MWASLDHLTTPRHDSVIQQTEQVPRAGQLTAIRSRLFLCNLTRQFLVSFKLNIARCLGLALPKVQDGWALFGREKLLPRSYDRACWDTSSDGTGFEG